MGCCNSCMRSQEGYEVLKEDNMQVAVDSRTVKNLECSLQACSSNDDVNRKTVEHRVEAVSALSEPMNTSVAVAAATSSKSRRSAPISVVSSDVHYQKCVSPFDAQTQNSAASPPSQRTIVQHSQVVMEELASSLNSFVASAMASATSSLSSSSITSNSVPNSEKEGLKHVPIFAGMRVMLKFMVESTFEPRFVWVDKRKGTLHLSAHMSKERRHKEARLADILSVEKPNPATFAAHSAVTGVGAADDVFCTVKFIKGGGIDVKFDSVESRDHFYVALSSLASKLRTQ